MAPINNKLTGKILIEGTIKVISGLRIGAGKDDIELGSPELPIVKTINKQPFIPGSSLKGKMRSLLARCAGSLQPENDPLIVKRLFGEAGNNDGETGSQQLTQLIFRDSYPQKLITTESKYENTIIRTSGAAKNPRQLERIPMDSVFTFEIVYNIFNEDENAIKKHIKVLDFGRQLLNDDYLGGCGSRGYGKVEMVFTKVTKKTIEFDENKDDFSFTEDTDYELPL